MNENWLPSLLIGLLLAMFALFGRVQLRSWLAPGAFFALVWSGFILLALIGAPLYEVSAAAIGWIFASTLAVYAGSLVGAYGLVASPKRSQALPATHFHFPCLRRILILCILLGIGSSFVLLKASGYGLATLLSLDTLAKIGHEFSVARYSLTYAPPLVVQLLLVFVYVSPLFGGALFVLESSRFNRLLAFLSLAPALLVVLVQTTRAAVLVAGIFWIASYLSTRVLLEGSAVRLFARGHFRAMLLAAPVLFAVLTLPRLMFRWGLTVLPSLSATVMNARGQILGSLSAFSQWFQHAWHYHTAPRFGIYTVGGLTRLFGEREPGLFYPLREMTCYSSTNITTFFNDLISDFTLPGSLLVLFAIALLAGWSYYRIAHGKKLYLPLLIGFYSFAMMGIMGSIFKYESTVVSLLVFFVYLLVSTLIYSGSGRNTVRAEGNL